MSCFHGTRKHKNKIKTRGHRPPSISCLDIQQQQQQQQQSLFRVQKSLQ